MCSAVRQRAGAPGLWPAKNRTAFPRVSAVARESLCRDKFWKVSAVAHCLCTNTVQRTFENVCQQLRAGVEGVRVEFVGRCYEYGPQIDRRARVYGVYYQLDVLPPFRGLCRVLKRV